MAPYLIDIICSKYIENLVKENELEIKEISCNSSNIKSFSIQVIHEDTKEYVYTSQDFSLPQRTFDILTINTKHESLSF